MTRTQAQGQRLRTNLKSVEEHQPLSSRQKASALPVLQLLHPPTVIAKLCSSAFQRNTLRILEDVCRNYALPPGTQPASEAIESDELSVRMKHAAVDISRTKFEVYNFATKL